MKVTANTALSVSKGDTVVLFVDKAFQYKQLASKLAFLRTTGGERFFQELKTVLYIPSTVNADVIIAPVAESSDTASAYRKAGADAVKIAGAHRLKKLSVMAPFCEENDKGDCIRWITEGLIIGGYSFDRYRSRDEKDEAQLKELEFVGIHGRDEKTIQKTAALCASVNNCRDTVNDITEKVNPETFEALAKKIARSGKMGFKVLSEKQLKSQGLNLICAVGRGSIYRPRMIILSYKGNSSSKEWSALVGKGVTFDSGGLNLKPSSSITDMRYDMAGAATVLYTLEAAAKLGIKQNIYAVIPLVENAIDAASYKPGDVFISYSGKSVQVLNTDAEGRLLLADALAYTEKKLKPVRIIDVATLTGACQVTFGWEYAGLLSTSDELSEKLCRASARSGEKIWRLPFDPAYDQKIKGDIADINNISSDRKAGTIIGGTFLKEFVSATPWAHIDIASTGWVDSPNGMYGKYATGFGVRLLTEFLSGDGQGS